ncbi:hypothetical protein TNCV_1460711 [Trichonephila clavipes]|nr:hypothetical protein TNCV_1460711 [Trichonephila clavipes]
MSSEPGNSKPERRAGSQKGSISLAAVKASMSPIGALMNRAAISRTLSQELGSRIIHEHFVGIVQTFLDTEKNPLLPGPARSPDVSPIENISSMVAERLARHRTPGSHYG